MQVEIWSDVVCPWCVIGKRRFERALAGFAHREQVTVVWRSFELDPHAPARLDGDLASRLAARYGISREQARARQEQLTQLAAEEGLAFHFDRARSGNTFDAHRLLHLANERGVQDALAERLFRAYFSEGEPIDDRETLVRLAAAVGLDPEEARAVLQADAYAEDVRTDEREAAALGITGVPFFVIDRRYGVSGAQAAEVLQQVLGRAWAEAHPAGLVMATGGPAPTCTDETCAS